MISPARGGAYAAFHYHGVDDDDDHDDEDDDALSAAVECLDWTPRLAAAAPQSRWLPRVRRDALHGLLWGTVQEGAGCARRIRRRRR